MLIKLVLGWIGKTKESTELPRTERALVALRAVAFVAMITGDCDVTFAVELVVFAEISVLFVHADAGAAAGIA